MLKPGLLVTCFAMALTGCITQPPSKVANTALTGACLAAHLYSCTLQSSNADKEAKAAAVRDQAQRDSTALNQEAARRSSCMIDDGPSLPVSSRQCAMHK